jgi:hypothetical protein
VLYGGQVAVEWTWMGAGAGGQVIGGGNTGAPAFETAACQSLYPGTQDLAAAVTAPPPGGSITGSEAFAVPPGAGELWLDDPGSGQLLAGIKVTP